MFQHVRPSRPQQCVGLQQSVHSYSIQTTRSFLPRTVHPTRQKSLTGLKSELGPGRLQSQNNGAKGPYTPFCSCHTVIETSTSCIASVPTREESNRATVSRCQVYLTHHDFSYISTVTLLVMLQPMKDEPALSAKCKDKFLIQSTLITPEKETKDLQDIVRIPLPRHQNSSQRFLVECSQWRRRRVESTSAKVACCVSPTRG